MSLVAASAPRVGSPVLVMYQGQPWRTLQWGVTGPATLAPITSYTDASGRAGALLTATTADQPLTVTVAAGA